MKLLHWTTAALTLHQTSATRSLLTLLCSPTCPRELCTCLTTHSSPSSCSSELHSVCTSGNIDSCVPAEGINQFRALHCPYAQCLVDGGSETGCTCDLYRSICEIYKEEDSTARYCEMAKCCRRQSDDDGRGDCLRNGAEVVGTRVPSNSLTGSPTDLREVSSGGGGGELVQNAFFFEWVGDDAFVPEEYLPESGEFTWVAPIDASETDNATVGITVTSTLGLTMAPTTSPSNNDSTFTSTDEPFSIDSNFSLNLGFARFCSSNCDPRLCQCLLDKENYASCITELYFSCKDDTITGCVPDDSVVDFQDIYCPYSECTVLKNVEDWSQEKCDCDRYVGLCESYGGDEDCSIANCCKNEESDGGKRVCLGGGGMVEVASMNMAMEGSAFFKENPTSSPTLAPITDSPTTEKPTTNPTQAPVTDEPTQSPSHIPTNSPTDSPVTDTPTKQPTPEPSSPPTSVPVTDEPTQSPSYVPSNSPTDSPVTAKPTKQPTLKPSSPPSASPVTDKPTDKPTQSPSFIPTNSPTDSPVTVEPTKAPTPKPSSPPSASPVTDKPTLTPSSVPTDSPTDAPITSNPSDAPIKAPVTNEPTLGPTYFPSDLPTNAPVTSKPIKEPTPIPSSSPTEPPITGEPTLSPSHIPTNSPTDAPVTGEPTTQPTPKPSSPPTAAPVTNEPTLSPSYIPSNLPTTSPVTDKPTSQPTDKPTRRPTQAPSSPPTAVPITDEPTLDPSSSPSNHPTSSPVTAKPTKQPTPKPSSSPTSAPITHKPTLSPSYMPSNSPTLAPVTSKPTKQLTPKPTYSPTEAPVTSDPTMSPSNSPSGSPTNAPISAKPTERPTQRPVTNSPTTDPSESPVETPSGSPSVADKPTSASPTDITTNSPTEKKDIAEKPMVYCPPAYDPLWSTSYSSGTQVEVDGTIYECNPYPYSIYCSLPSFEPVYGNKLWVDAWSEISSCVATKPRSASPSASPTTKEPSKRPTSKPTKLAPSMSPSTKNEPTEMPTTDEPTLSPSYVPANLPTDSPITNKPTAPPTTNPTTMEPSYNLTSEPTKPLTKSTTASPSIPATLSPTESPTESPIVDVISIVQFQMETMTKTMNEYELVGVFQPSCNQFLTRQLISNDPHVFDIKCKVTRQQLLSRRKLADSGIRSLQLKEELSSLLVDIETTGVVMPSENVTSSSDVNFDELVYDAFAKGSDLFINSLKNKGDVAGIDAFDDLTSVTSVQQVNEKGAISESSGSTNQGFTAGALSAIIIGGVAVLVVFGVVLYQLRSHAADEDSLDDDDNDDLDNVIAEMGLEYPQNIHVNSQTFNNIQSEDSANRNDNLTYAYSLENGIDSPNSLTSVQKPAWNDEAPTRIQRVILAPPGKLGIIIDTSSQGPIVHSVKDQSVLEGLVFEGDLIVALDDEDTSEWSAHNLTKLVASKSKYERKITVLSVVPQ